METLKKIWSDIVAFMTTGNNLYYCIAGAVALILIIVIIAICVSKGKKRRKAKRALVEPPKVIPTETPVVNNDISNADKSEFMIKEERLAKSTAPYGSSVAVEYKHLDVKEPVAVSPKIAAETIVSNKKAQSEVVIDTIAETAPIRKEKLTKAVEVKPVAKKAKPIEAPAEVIAKSDVSEKEITQIDAQREMAAEALATPNKRPGFVQIYQDAGGKFRFRIKASNKETVAHSQGYTTKGSCKNGIKAVAAIAESAIVADTTKTDYIVTIGKPAFEIYKDSDGKFRFRLRAANTNTILASQGYTSKDNCFNGIRSVRFVALNHSVDDVTIVKNND